MTLAERAQQFLKDYGLAIPEQYGTWQLVKDQGDRIRDLEAAVQEIIRTAKDPDHDLLLRLRFIVTKARAAQEERK